MLANKLPGYESIRSIAKFKAIEVDLGSQLLKLEVRVPLRSELDEINRKISLPNQDAIDHEYKNLTKDLKLDDPDFLTAAGLMKDFVVDGKSITYKGTDLKVLAWQLASWHVQVELYFALIRSATSEPIKEPYEQIASEFTDEQIRNFVLAISAAINPQADEVKKN